jgi:chaperonin GroEL
MEKEVLYSREARDKIFNGIDKIYNAIKITIGPKGRNVVIDKNKYPIIVNDGITIAKNFKLKNNRFENIGAKLIRQAANKTEKNAGDGTTGTTILTYEIIKNGLKYINDNYNPTPIKKYLNKFKKIIIEEIEKQSIKINNESQIEQIATISANNDKEIGKIIKEAIKNN